MVNLGRGSCMINTPENFCLPAYLFNSEAIVAAVFRTDGSLLHTNTLFDKIFGRKDPQLPAVGFANHLCPPDLQHFQNAVQQCLSGSGKPVSVRLNMLAEGGEKAIRYYDWELSKIPAPEVQSPAVLALGVGQAEQHQKPAAAQSASAGSDAPAGQNENLTGSSCSIPHHKKYEDELQEEKRFSEILLGSLPDLVFLFDGRGTYLDVRGSKENLLLPEKEVIGRNIADFMSADSAEMLLKLISDTLEGKPVTGAEYSFLVKGELRYFESRCVKYDDDRVLMLIRDISSRKKAEIERDIMLAEYEALFDNNHTATFVIRVGEDGRFVYLRTNKTHIKATGLSPEMLWNKSPEEVFGKEFGAELSENYRKCLDQEETLLYEEELDLPAGKKNWLTALKLVRINPHTALIIGSSADITGLKENEKALRKQTEQLEQISEVSRVGGFEYFPKEKRLFWTRMTKKIHAMPENYQPELEAAFSFFTKPEHRNKIEAAASEAILQGKPYDLELQITDGDGTEKWVRAIGTTAFENGECVRLYGTFQDIDAQKRLERLSRANEQRYMNILQAAPNGMVVITDMKIDYINPSGLVLLGAGRMADVVGKYVKELVHPDDYLLGSLKIIDMINGKPMKFPHELRLIKNDGSFIDAEITAAFLPSVETPALLVIFSDITERKNNRRAIEEQNRVLRQIAWEQSHVVRAPVSRLMCLADAIETADFQIISQKEMLDGIVQSAQELDDIIRDISDKANRLLHPEVF